MVDFASIPDVPKSPEDSIFLTEALKKQWLFASMDSEALSMVINKMTTRDYKQGDEIVKQGEEGIEVRVYVYVYVCLSTGHNQKPNIFFLMCFLFLFYSFHFLFFPLQFFVIANGSCGVKVGGKELAHTILAGGGFGELALFYEEPRSATVFAKEITKTWILDKKTFRGGLARRVEEMCSENSKFLMQVPFFKEFEGDPALEQYVQKVAEAMVPVDFVKGDQIIQQGEEGNTFYIVIAGECSIDVDGEEKEHTLTVGNWFGEKALVGESQVRTASVKATTDVKCIGMDRASFKELMGPFEVFRSKEHFNEQSTLGQEQVKAPSLDLANYEYRRVLGVGGFGLVSLYSRKTDGELFALKKMQKALIVQEEMQKFVRQEKLFLAELSGNGFVPILDGSAKDDDSVYLMLEFLSGGDLFSLIERDGPLDESTVVQFTAACTILGLQHVHKHSIAFRDLKLENLVVDSKGYVKLVDFGLAKRILARSYTFCGSPRYCAPEMVTGKGHNKGVDWWALGVVLFETLFAMSPFDDNCDDVELFRRIANEPLEFPEYPKLQPKCRDFITQLLQKDHTKRLGALADGSDGCIKHQWFSNLNWNDLRAQKMSSPIKVDPYKQSEDKSASDAVEVPEMHSVLTKYRSSTDPMVGWDDAF